MLFETEGELGREGGREGEKDAQRGQSKGDGTEVGQALVREEYPVMAVAKDG